MPALTMKHVFALLKLDMFHTSDNVTLVRVRVRVRVRFRVRVRVRVRVRITLIYVMGPNTAAP